MEKICGIYKIASPSRKIYIGQSVNIKKRWNEYKRLDCKKQSLLYHSLQKHGVDKHSFEILCQCRPEELNNLEIYYIELYQSFNSEYGLNLIEGGKGIRGYRHTEDSKKIMRDKKIGNKNGEKGHGMLGHCHSKRTKEKIKNARLKYLNEHPEELKRFKAIKIKIKIT